MMNIVALCLVVTSLATAGVLSPSPSTEKSQDHEVVVAKEGFKVIVVEYEREGTGKTKVSISPQPEDHEPDHAADKIINEEIEDKPVDHEKEKASSSNNKANAKELICDAFGKCKHRIAGTFGKAKEKVAEKAHEVEEEVEEAVEAVGGAFGKGKEAVSRKVSDTEKRHEDACDKAKNTIKTAIDTGKTLEGDVRGNVSEDLDIVCRKAAGMAKQGLETAETAADKVKDTVKDKAKEGLETAEMVKNKAKEGLETAETASHKVKDTVKDKAETASHKLKDMVKNKEKKTADLVRRARDYARDASTCLVAAVSSSIGSLLGVIHMLGFAMAYGMSVWITFVSSYVLANALPRQQFGMVQSKIYPLYFRAMAYSIGMALLGHLLSQRRNFFDSKAEVFQGYNLIASLLLVFANLLYLEPLATKVMFERMKVEKEEGRGGRDMTSIVREPTGSVNIDNPAATTTAARTAEQEAARSRIVELNERLKNLNSFSSALNILTVMFLTWHLVYLGQRLHMSSCR